ncbi:ArsR/SmtB family transcription factor [Streptomyces griseoluteus]|uniref:ArsR/SmtB family transcription factor n=1 Tax=Streptomyces griseoluteus TaxID=29306 RepID=UPI00368E1F6B
MPCCPPITAGELSVADSEKMAAMFKALSDAVRLRLFSKIASHLSGEACVCDIQDMGVSQPTVSHHLKKLREAGLLTSERRGTWVYYTVAPSGVAGMPAMLDLKR